MVDFMVEVFQYRRIPNTRTVPQPEEEIQIQIELLTVSVEGGNEKLKRENIKEQVGPRRRTGLTITRYKFCYKTSYQELKINITYSFKVLSLFSLVCSENKSNNSCIVLNIPR